MRAREADELLHDEAAEHRARVRFDGDHARRAGLLQHPRVAALERPDFEHLPSLDASERRKGPGHARILEHGERSRRYCVERRRQA